MLKLNINNNIIDKFKKSLNSLAPDVEGKAFGLAVSGGADSWAMLELFLECFPGCQPVVLHYNHNLRKESKKEEVLVKELTEKKGLTFFSAEGLVFEIAKKRKKGLEEAARWARYKFFEKAQKEFNLNYILTGHHSDDQLETVLMALIRGTGLSGLKGIPPQRGIYLRPLLDISRKEIEDFLKAKKIKWLEDASNYEKIYVRNKLRLEIVPKLKEYNANILNSVSKLTTIINEEETFWQKHIAKINETVILREQADFVLLKKAEFLKLSLAEQRRVLHLSYWNIWKNSSCVLNEPPSYLSVSKSLNYLKTNVSKGIDLPGGLRIELKKDEIILTLASRILKNRVI